jgi:hypothetical protein
MEQQDVAAVTQKVVTHLKKSVTQPTDNVVSNPKVGAQNQNRAVVVNNQRKNL